MVNFPLVLDMKQQVCHPKTISILTTILTTSESKSRNFQDNLKTIYMNKFKNSLLNWCKNDILASVC